MSKRNWGVRTAVVGALIALSVVSLGTGAYFGALNAPHYGYQSAHPSYRGPQPEQSSVSQIDRDRAGLPYFAERIASGPDPEDGSEREKRDLAAQESMSVWAFWLLLVSSIGAAATIIGTVFLLWQIMLTREAVKDTGDATKAMEDANRIARDGQSLQVKPWLQITLPENMIAGKVHRFEEGEASPRPVSMMGVVKITNLSNSPAMIRKSHTTAVGQGVAGSPREIPLRQPIEKGEDIWLPGASSALDQFHQSAPTSLEFGYLMLTPEMLELGFPNDILLIVRLWYLDMIGTEYELSQCWRLHKAGVAERIYEAGPYNYDRPANDDNRQHQGG